MKTFYVVVVGVIALWCSYVFATAANTDSLLRVIERRPLGIATVMALNDYAMVLHETFPDSTRRLAERAFVLADSLGDNKGKALSLNVIGVSYFIQNNYDKALSYYLQALSLREKIGDMKGVAGTLNNVGMVYRDMKEHGTALSYYFRALRLNDSLQNKQFYVRNLNNIGVAYENMNLFDSALTYHRLSLELKRALGDKAGMASSLRNIGKVFGKMKRYSEALAMLHKGLAMPEAGKQVRALILLDIAAVHEATGELDAAVAEAKKAMVLGQELGSALLLEQGHEILARLYAATFQHELAFENFKRFITIRDSLFNEASTRRLAALQTNYELDRQRTQIELLTKERALQTTVRNGLIAGVALSLLLFLVIAVAYRNKRRSEGQLRQTNDEILRQQHLLSHQAQEIEITNIALAENNIKLAAANDRLTALNTEKDEIMSIVAHDLKNPIAAVTGFADILRGDDLSHEDKESVLDQLDIIGNRILDLVKNMLDSYRIESGGVEMRIVQLDIAPVVVMSMDMYRERAAQKNITLHWEESSIDSTVLIDEQIFNQIFDNLLSNAFKYSPHGKNVWVRIRHSSDKEGHSPLVIGHVSGDNNTRPMTTHQVTNDQVTNDQVTNDQVTNDQVTNGYLRIEVADEGPGISEEDMKLLFGKFARLSAQPTGGEHSTGLGLSIVKKMVEAMNGRVWCESELGHGATFIVELPKA